MKRKIISIALSLALLWVAAFSTAAQTENSNISAEPITQIGDNNTVMPLAANSAITSNAVYRIRNVGSGKYLNLHYGVDANSTNVYQWTYDGSTEQKWRVAYNSGTDSYQFYSMSSSGGKNRLLDISRGGASLTSGQNVAVWEPVDPYSHEMQITAVATGKYKIYMKGNTNLCLAAYGNSNGTADGRSATSAGNVFISTYTGEAHQMWVFEPTGETAVAPASGFLDYVSSTGLGGWAWRSDLPNSPIDVHIYIDNLTTGQSWFYVTLANIYRADLENAGYGNGCHGYYYSIDWGNYPSGNYRVHTYAIGGGNPLLSGGPIEYSVTTQIGYKGYAAYRDLSFNIDSAIVSFDDWHAGLMDEPYASYNLPIIHVSKDSSSLVTWDQWSTFLDNLTYRGLYKPKQELSDNQRTLVVSLARELRTKDIGYIVTHQLQATLWPDRTKIEPDAIVSLRCDGLIEYCYEYYGIRIFGSNDLWDISVSSAENLAHHSYKNIMPKKQAQNYMTLITTNIPNP